MQFIRWTAYGQQPSHLDAILVSLNPLLSQTSATKKGRRKLLIQFQVGTSNQGIRSKVFFQTFSLSLSDGIPFN